MAVGLPSGEGQCPVPVGVINTGAFVEWYYYYDCPPWYTDEKLDRS